MCQQKSHRSTVYCKYCKYTVFTQLHVTLYVRERQRRKHQSCYHEQTIKLKDSLKRATERLYITLK